MFIRSQYQYRQNRRRTTTTTTTTTESGLNRFEGVDEPEVGVEPMGNYVEYMGYGKEEHNCPQGQVKDIYGYCRSV